MRCFTGSSTGGHQAAGIEDGRDIGQQFRGRSTDQSSNLGRESLPHRQHIVKSNVVHFSHRTFEFRFSSFAIYFRFSFRWVGQILTKCSRTSGLSKFDCQQIRSSDRSRGHDREPSKEGNCFSAHYSLDSGWLERRIAVHQDILSFDSDEWKRCRRFLFLLFELSA